MIEKLTVAPDEQIDLSGDEAEMLLFELGILDRFSTQFKKQSLETAVTFAGHETHRILGIRYTDKSDPYKNDFVAFCFPKSKVTDEEFQKVASQFTISA